MIGHRTASLLTVLSALIAMFPGTPPWLGILSGAFAAASAIVAWWLGEAQNSEAVMLRHEVNSIENRTKVEHGVAAAFTGQGQLATWNYSTLITHLRIDGHV